MPYKPFLTSQQQRAKQLALQELWNSLTPEAQQDIERWVEALKLDLWEKQCQAAQAKGQNPENIKLVPLGVLGGFELLVTWLQYRADPRGLHDAEIMQAYQNIAAREGWQNLNGTWVQQGQPEAQEIHYDRVVVLDLRPVVPGAGAE